MAEGRAVRLQPMTSAEYDAWVDGAIAHYAEVNVDAGLWSSEEAGQQARAAFERILPNGLATPDQFLYTIHAPPNDARVGMVWLAKLHNTAVPIGYVYNLEIDPAARRHGYAEAAMRAIEPIAKGQGADRILLNVFATNVGARALYEKLGYETKTHSMMKRLPG